MEKNFKRGRRSGKFGPYKAPEDRKSAAVASIPVTPEQEELIRGAAARLGVGVTEFIRSASVVWAEAVKKSTRGQ